MCAHRGSRLTITITVLRRLTADEESAVAEEGARLLAFRSPDDAALEIRFTTGT